MLLYTDEPCFFISFQLSLEKPSHLQIVKTIPKFHSFCRKLNIFHGCQSESSTISCRVMRQCRQIVLKRATGGRFLTTPIRCPNKHESFTILLWIANFPSVGDTKLERRGVGRGRVIDFLLLQVFPQKHIFSIHHYHLFATFATSQQSKSIFDGLGLGTIEFYQKKSRLFEFQKKVTLS